MTAASLALRTVLETSDDAGGAIAPAFTTAMIDGAAGIMSIEAAWRRVAAFAPNYTPFLDYGFALALARYHEARGERVVTAVVDWNGAPACFLPVAITRQGGVRVALMLGDPAAQYGDALLAADAPVTLPALALTALKGRADIDVFSFRRVRDDAALHGAISACARPAETILQAPYARFAEGTSAEAMMIEIGGSKQKRERARLRRRLAENGEIRFEARRGAAALPLIREAFALKRERLDEAGHASPVVGDPATMLVFEQAALDAQGGDAIVAFRLLVADRPAAMEFGVIRGGAYHAYLGVMADDHASASPGRVLMEDVVVWCREQGCDMIDLLPPADAYKRLWSNGLVDVRDYTIPVSFAGALYAGPWLKVVRPRLRAFLDRLPPAIRARVGAAALKAGAR